MSCGEACGWVAAACSALAFGTFAVPIKSDAARSVDIDPLVFQSYKTFVCFATSWLILLSGEEFTFTPWGIVSGLFWVPGGVATVYAVKSAGLAIAIGIGSSLIVLVSFIWGIFVFGERIHSTAGASFAIFCMMTGLFGMSYYSSPVVVGPNSAVLVSSEQCVGTYQGIGSSDEDCDGVEVELESDRQLTHRTIGTAATPTPYRDDVEVAVSDEEAIVSIPDPYPSVPSISPVGIVMVEVCGCEISKRRLGMMAAAFCGIWGGSIMAPMKFCKANTKGTHYLLSFAIGATIVNVALWLLRYAYHVVRCRSLVKAYDLLPGLHLRVMWLAGGTSGLLWSIGNFLSLISVFYLGEGVGYPLVQTSVLVSGLWGILYFKEVQGTERISNWFLSSLLTVVGILLLSYEHHEG